jgi:hypothetical protein
MSDEENHIMLLKSVSAPVSSKYRGKGFVRPNCSTTFWLYCPVCCKRYFKYDSHFDCFQRWCEICQDVLPSAIELEKHSLTYHKKNYCQDCNHVFENLRGHRTYEHAGGTGGTAGTAGTGGDVETKISKKTRITRAKTSVAQKQNGKSKDGRE